MTKSIKVIIAFVIIASTLASAPSLSNQWVKRFDIRPGTCIVDESELQCIREFFFYWQLNEAHLICIYQKHQTEPLYCSNKNIEGRATISLSIDSENEFILVSKSNANLQVRRKVSVHQLGIDVRKARRHLWSVF